MGKKNLFKKLLLLPISGFLFVASLSTPVSAIPEPAQPNETIIEEETDNSSTPNQSTEESENTNTDNTKNDEDKNKPANNCYESVESLSWFVCPVVSVVSSAVDFLYSTINNFLVIKPITFNDESPIYMVWSTSRDVANIVFIILILVIVFSHLTGIGFNNYDIKKTLPRLVIAAILVNISFIICSLAVDVSNIIGSSLNNFFNSITLTLQGGNAVQLSWTDIIGRIVGTAGTAVATTGIAAGAIALSGGLGHFIFLIIPVVFGAIVSLGIGVLTIAFRQAVVALLVMVAPLAFVTYLLPNTEQYFKKWKDTLTQMLIFFPIFALLYGASSLAGWTFILNGDQNNNIFEILIGMAIQVFPLIFSFKLLKMSDTILGRVNDTLNNLSQPLQNTIRNISAEQAATQKAKYDAKNLSRSFTGINRFRPANLRSFAAKRQFELAENRRLAEDTRQKILQEYTIARQMNKSITFDEKGRRVLSTHTKTDGMTEAMSIALQNREANLNLSSMELSRDNALNQVGDYAKNEKIEDDTIQTISARQARNFLDFKTETNAKHRNSIGDEQFYANQVLSASELNEDGKPVNRQAYENLIVRGGGINALKSYDYDTGKINNNATASVIANAYDLTEAERQNEMKRFTTYLDTQSTKQVESAITDAMKAKDVNNFIAGLNNIYNRGDTDLIEKYVRKYMNDKNLEIGTEDANHLAFALLQMKKAPSLRRLGKFINVETRSYTNGKRGELSKQFEELKKITYDEFTMGEREIVDKNGNTTVFHPKFDIISTLEGTPFKEIERTAMDALIQAEYESGPNGQGIGLERIREIDGKILPQLVSAIPTFDSGSEQLISVIKYITGMGIDKEDGKWKTNERTKATSTDLRKNVNFSEFALRTRQYLKSFTANDLISMKSDAFNAVKALFEEEFEIRKNNNESLDQDNATDYFKAEFRKIFSNQKAIYVDNTFKDSPVTINGTGVLDQLMRGDPSAYNGMKNPIREVLGLR